MGIEACRKVQVLFPEGCGGGWRVVDSKNDRASTSTRFVHDWGGGTDAFASFCGVAQKGLLIEHAGSFAGGEGDKNQLNRSLGGHGENDRAS